MTDQLRADCVGYAPDSRIVTPHIDRLTESVAFTNCVRITSIVSSVLIDPTMEASSIADLAASMNELIGRYA